eukprot:m.306505 g.306505  ORF g.306505 m.306505 type:complete len:871 (+) comp19011_c0_seq1:135-2747(+)
MSSDDSPFEAKRATFTITTAAARSTFLAGFAYYEIGRYGFARGSDTSYIAFLSGSFALAVVSAVFAGFIHFWLERKPTNDLKVSFVEQVNGIGVRTVHRLFILALLLYIIGLTRIGWVYYPSTDFKYVPMVAFIVAFVLIIYGMVVIVRASVELVPTESSTQYVQALDDNQVSARLIESHGNARLARLVVRFYEGESPAEFVLHQAKEISSRSIFITGFAQSGVARYIATSHPAGHTYLFFITFSCIAAVIAAFIMSNIAIFLHDVPPARRDAFALRIVPLSQLCFVAYLGSVFSLMIATVFMGWGCGFERDAWITFFTGVAGFGMFLLGIFEVVRIHRQAEAEAPTYKKHADDVLKTRTETFLKKIGTTGSLASLAASFVFYNVVTYSTDILPLASNTTWKRFFLVVNTLTFVIGSIAAVYESIIVLWLKDLTSLRAQYLFSKKARFLSSVCLSFFQISLFLFIGGFAIFSKVKFEPAKVEPFAIGMFGLTAVAASQLVMMFKTRSFAKAAARGGRNQNSGTSGYAGLTEGLLDDAEKSDHGAEAMLESAQSEQHPEDAITKSQMDQVNLLANRALFFGAFAYFAISFFFTPTRDQSTPYLVFMSIAFVSAITLLSWSTLFTVMTIEASSYGQSGSLTAFLGPLYRASTIIPIVTFAAFFTSFGLIGYVKPVQDYQDYAPVMAVGAVLGCIGVVYFVYMVVLRFRRVLAIPVDQLPHDEFRYQRMIDQTNAVATQAAFVAGNVFFEILFTIVGPYRGANYFYFLTGTITFVVGGISVATATAFSVFMTELRDKRQCARFGREIKGLKTAAFALNSIAMFSWLFSLTVFGAVKYHKKYVVSLSWAVPSILLLAWLVFKTKRISDALLVSS